MELGPRISNVERCCYIELIAMCGVYNEDLIKYVVEEMV